MSFLEANRWQPLQLTGNECRTQAVRLTGAGINFLGVPSGHFIWLRQRCNQSQLLVITSVRWLCNDPFIQQVSVSSESHRQTWHGSDRFLDIRRLRSEQVAPLLHSRSIPAAIANLVD